MLRTEQPSGEIELQDVSDLKYEMRPSDLTNEGAATGTVFDADGKNTQLDSSFDDHHLFKNSILEDSPPPSQEQQPNRIRRVVSITKL